MAKLTDYLEPGTLQQLQDAFAIVARLPIRLCDSQGAMLTKPSPLPPRRDGDADDCWLLGPTGEGQELKIGCDVPIMVHQQVVGTIAVGGGSVDKPVRPVAAKSQSPAGEIPTRVLRYLGLMANVISRMCDRENQLRARIDELAALYHLTAEFTSRRDLQGLLDLVASTVVKVLGVKACSIRLLSEDHTELVIKAVANLSAEYLSKGAILVSKSVVDEEVLRTKKPVYIADEQDDPRVMFPTQAQREGIVSALCAPLVYKGRAEGVIHVYTGRKHQFDWFEESLLLAMAGEAAAAIVNARLYEEAVRSASMKRALNMAGEVQRRMIPAQPPQVPGFQIGAIYVPTYELSGDFYDFISLPPDNVGIAVCDVAGKGVRASLLTASIRASLRAHATNIYDISQVMGRVNRDLCEDALTSDFATLFYGVLDFKARRFTYVNAGHPSPLLFRKGQSCTLSSGGLIIGIDSEAKWAWDSFLLESGDVILAFTDGLVETLNFADESFGRARVEKAAQDAIAQSVSAEGIVHRLLWEMRRFAGLQTRFDDLTMVALKVL